MAALDWLWGALAGAGATLAGSEVLARQRFRRTVDGAAIDLARKFLDVVPIVHRELRRAEDYRDHIPTMCDVVTAELRDETGRTADQVRVRLRDPQLNNAFRQVHAEISAARSATRDYDGNPLTAEEQQERYWDDLEGTKQYSAFVRIHTQGAAAAATTAEALECMASLESSRPRR